MVLRRMLLALGAAVLVVLGLALAAGAVGLWASVGWAGIVRAALPPISSPAGTAAVLMDIDSVDASSTLPLPGTPVLAASPAEPTGGEVVLLAGSAQEADTYLAGAGYGVARLDRDAWTLTTVPGPVALPGWQSGPWQAADAGASAQVPIQPPQTVILRSADGTAPVRADLELRWLVPHAQRSILILGVVGALVALAGGALAWGAAVMRWDHRD